jgi:hypothetical protein
MDCCEAIVVIDVTITHSFDYCLFYTAVAQHSMRRGAEGVDSGRLGWGCATGGAEEAGETGTQRPGRMRMRRVAFKPLRPAPCVRQRAGALLDAVGGVEQRTKVSLRVPHTDGRHTRHECQLIRGIVAGLAAPGVARAKVGLRVGGGGCGGGGGGCVTPRKGLRRGAYAAAFESLTETPHVRTW